VRQVEEEHQAQRERYKQWKEENKRLTRSFAERLRERGFTGLWESSNDAVVVTAFWGHNHGLELNYEHVTYPDV
jgi:hypothetical protein